MAYKALIDRFDMERGDALTLPLDTATELAALPCEIAAPVIHALLVWFTGGEVATLPDPRDNALLRRLVVHQTMNAQRRADFLARQRSNRLCGNVNHGQPRSTTVDQDKNKSKASEDVALDRDEVNHAACAASPAGLSALQAEPADLAATDTAIYSAGYFGSDEIVDVFYEQDGKTPLCDLAMTKTRFMADPVSALMEYPDFDSETDKATFRNALIARQRADKAEFVNIAWRYVADAHNARVAFIYAIRKANVCESCGGDPDFCSRKCPHSHLKHLAAQYEKDFASDVFVKNLLGRLKVLKP